MPFTDDASAFFVEDEFTELVTIAGESVKAIFDNQYSRVGVMLSTSDPALWCQTADVSTVARGAVAIVRGVTYAVRDIQPDGTGITVLQLERA
jgi:hypothetical protein